MLTRSPTKPRNRRKLGRGQSPHQSNVAVTVTGSASVASLSFSQPVIVTGPVPLTVGTRTFVSQQLTSPTLLLVTMSGAVTGLVYALGQDQSVLRGEKGQQVNAAGGTFS